MLLLGCRFTTTPKRHGRQETWQDDRKKIAKLSRDHSSLCRDPIASSLRQPWRNRHLFGGRRSLRGRASAVPWVASTAPGLGKGRAVQRSGRKGAHSFVPGSVGLRAGIRSNWGIGRDHLATLGDAARVTSLAAHLHTYRSPKGKGKS